MSYKVLAFYLFTPVADPRREVADHKIFLSRYDARARIYISEEGINGQMSIAGSDLEAYLCYLEGHPLWHSCRIKMHEWPEHAFAKLTVKYRAELVALGRKVDTSNTAVHISPADWEARLEAKESDTIVLDVRNAYESKVGHFTGAILPDIETFREFPAFAEKLAARVDLEKTRVMMYCTGGIRCELYGALMKEIGFKDVAQLDGGVIGYGLEKGSRHWEGKLFVFDDRLVVPLSEEAEPITACRFCDAPVDLMFNCANMDCNALFTACKSCIERHHGCCSDDCFASGRVRPLHITDHPKPFRKLPKEMKQRGFTI
ncbi:MAG: hypothetical protein A3F09_00595 [Chlamydiae bacterium RIFCSPHIGHO2_12_FULL_49_11]|nr:MAG: hypothetical protein A3F09_00595 [Chlamydiae bacterium RIFCSPHIGHO2_12_FULL_49_11]